MRTEWSAGFSRLGHRLKPVLHAILLLAVACGSSSVSKPPVVAADPQIADLQASMTELLERLDVMNARITKLEKVNDERGAAGGATAVPAVESPAARDGRRSTAPQRSLKSAEIAEAYRNAIVLYGKNRFVESRAAFQQVFDADPSGELADNALFWVGETYFAANDFNNAIRFYKRVGDEYGDQNKAPDALYKLALAYEKTSDLALARTTLQEVIARYPYSAPAASAKSELNRIKY
ncbi:MAG TPA: tetratricopeptide repeat protein [Thermoanaerobaculia bacterium]|nr:tetratricopeptide repeat protein [Thermoanaerobaculia bacterium]